MGVSPINHPFGGKPHISIVIISTDYIYIYIYTLWMEYLSIVIKRPSTRSTIVIYLSTRVMSTMSTMSIIALVSIVDILPLLFL